MKKLLITISVLLGVSLLADKGDVYLRNGKVYKDVDYAYLVKTSQMSIDFNECPIRTIKIPTSTVLKTENHDYVFKDCKQMCKKQGLKWNGRKCIKEEVKVTEPTGKTFKNSLGMEFVLIPSGTYTMGCSAGDSDCESNESPAHKVKISNAFYMGKYEVTQGQWKAVMGENPSYFVGSNCNSPNGCDNHPVERVSWNDVQEFIKKLNEKFGSSGVSPEQYRLPTEAEWEYAARAGSTTKYYYGNDESILGEYAWYSSNSDSKTHPVGQKKPNAFGLYDTSGNVWEWCADWYGDSYYKQFENQTTVDPKGPDLGSNRVLRGGSWFNDPRNARSSDRAYWYPGYRYYDIGFRLILSSL